MDRKTEILNCIIGYMQEHGYAPTVREIGDRVGLRSSSSVHRYLVEMRDSGMIETDVKEGFKRAIRVPGYAFVKEQSA